MKNKIMIIMILINFTTNAEICYPTSSQKEFEKQNQWQTLSINDKQQNPVILGLYDEKNNEFHIKDLSHKKNVEANLYAKTSKYLTKYCQLNMNADNYLSAARILKDNNHYFIDFNFLPNLSDFSNYPYNELKLNVFSFDLYIDYSDDAIINQQQRSKDLKQSLYQNIYQQIDNQKTNKSFKVDLTNYDDFVCDLLLGKASITVIKRMNSRSPLIEKQEFISNENAIEAYEFLKKEIDQFSGSKAIANLTGLILSKFVALKPELKSLFYDGIDKLAKVFSTTDRMDYLRLNSKDLLCKVNSLHEYHAKEIIHRVRSDVSFNQAKKTYLTGEN